MNFVVNNRIHGLVIHYLGFEAAINTMGDVVSVDGMALKHCSSLWTGELLAPSSKPGYSGNEYTDCHSRTSVVHIARIDGVGRWEVKGDRSESKVQNSNDVEPDTEFEVVRAFEELWSFACPATPQSDCEGHDIR